MVGLIASSAETLESLLSDVLDLARIESDRGHHGKVDTWEYYADDNLDRIGTDTDGDGQVDHWERRGKEVKESKATATDTP